jgi:hypothetical protein
MIKTYFLCLPMFVFVFMSSAAGAELLADGGFDDPGAWAFHQFDGGGTGGVSGGVGFITHPGGGGQGGTLSDEIQGLVSGNWNTVMVDRRFTQLGPSAVAELWVGEDPALAGGADYPGGVAGTMILKDDCWGGSCSSPTLAPMPVDGAVGNPWDYSSSDWVDGRVWFVLKVSGWGPGFAQTVEFDNASVDLGWPAVSDWSLY